MVQDKVRFFYEKSALNDKNVLIVDKRVAINKVGHNLHGLVRKHAHRVHAYYY